MKIGIIGAMDIEIQKLKSRMTDSKTEEISGIEFHSGMLFGKNAVIAVSGIGKVNSAMCTQTMILTYKPDIIINSGVAGGRHDLKISDAVVAESVVQHDFDTSPVGEPVGLIPKVNLINIPCTPRVVSALTEASGKITTTHTGVIATGDKFINSRELADDISDKFNALAYEMEGGSIGHVCYLNKIEFGVLRAISDNGDEESAVDFVTFAEDAADKSIKIMEHFFEVFK